MRSSIHLAIALAALCGACGGGAPAADGYPSSALVSATSQSGALHIELRSRPQQPPTRGVATIRFTIEDKSGAPLDGLQLTVLPWMNAMGHGTSVAPTVTALGGGIYDVSNVYLPMPGQWDLKTTIGGPMSDSVDPAFQVQ